MLKATREKKYKEAFDKLCAALLDCERAAKPLGMVQRPDENRWDALFRFRYKTLYGKEHPTPADKIDPKKNTLQLIVMKHAHRKAG